MATNFPRALNQQLQEELHNDKIILLTGPRQAGKTTLLKQLEAAVKAENGVLFYYNFDRLVDLDFFKSQQKVEAFLKLRSLKQRVYIFIDEVQRKADAGTFFKYFYDAGLNVKFVFTGSSSLELNDSFGDGLTGRKRVYTLFPLSLAEIGRGELTEEYQYALAGDPLAASKYAELVADAAIWGSYPEVKQKAAGAARLRVLGELYESYIQKDVKDLLRVKNISGFNSLVQQLALQIGQPVVVDELSKQTGLHNSTVNSYLDILEGTGIVAFTQNFNPNAEAGLPKSRRVYFLDNGMRNFAIKQLQTEIRNDWQALSANLLYTELRKRLPYGAQIYHYQTYSDNFLDFIVQTADSSAFKAIQVRQQRPFLNEDGTSSSDAAASKLGKNLHEYLRAHQPAQLIIVEPGTSLPEEEVKGTAVVRLELAELLLNLEELATV